MKSRKPFSKHPLSQRVLSLFHPKSAEDQWLDREIEAAAARMSETPVPEAGPQLLDQLGAIQSGFPQTSVKRFPLRRMPAFALVAGTAVVALVIVYAGRHRGEPNTLVKGSPRSIGGPQSPRSEHHDQPALPESPKVVPNKPEAPSFAVKGPGRHLSGPGSKPAPAPDSDFLNPGRNGVSVAYGSKKPAGSQKLPRMKDDFVVPEALMFAFNANDEELAAMSRAVREDYEREAQVVDSRLFKDVTISMKHASFDEICAELKRQTSVEIRASRNFADENATIFVTARPCREVMREISRLFGVIWERSGRENEYVYTLKQDTPAQVAEQKMRNDDVSKAIEAITQSMRSNGYPQGSGVQTSDGNNLKPPHLKIAQKVFQNLSMDELEVLRSGKEICLMGSKMNWSKDKITSILPEETVTDILKTSGGVRLYGNFYMTTNDANSKDTIPFSELRHASAGLSYLLRISEFGGASLSGEVYNQAQCPDDTWSMTGLPMSYGKVPGASEADLDNAAENAAMKNEAGFATSLTLDPSLTTPLNEQTVWVEGPKYGTVTDYLPSYRSTKELQPPRPYMTSDDFWQAVHEKTHKDVITDSFSRLFALQEFKGSLFDVLSKGSNWMHYHWKLDEGFVTGRSASFHWQRLNEVPKRFLIAWQRQRSANGWLPLRGVLDMSTMSDHQLDSIEVGKAIVNQWKLPEWGIPSRPTLVGPHEMVRPICRFLASLPEEKLIKAENGTLQVDEVRNQLQAFAGVVGPSGTKLRVDYIPPEKYFWQPFFEKGKDEVHTDLIYGSTHDEVINEVRRRFPNYVQDEVSYSNGLMGLMMDSLPMPEFVASAYDIGDRWFFVGQKVGNR